MTDQVSNIGVRLTLEDNFTGPLAGATQALNKFQQQATKAGSGAGQMKAGGGKVAASGPSGGQSLEGVNVSLTVNQASLAALRTQIIKGLGTIPVTVTATVAANQAKTVMAGMITPAVGTRAGAAHEVESTLRRNLPQRASGGPVAAHQAVIVGEKRPEVFVPRQHGTIVRSLAEYRRQEAELAAVEFQIQQRRKRIEREILSERDLVGHDYAANAYRGKHVRNYGGKYGSARPGQASSYSQHQDMLWGSPRGEPGYYYHGTGTSLMGIRSRREGGVRPVSSIWHERTDDVRAGSYWHRGAPQYFDFFGPNLLRTPTNLPRSFRPLGRGSQSEEFAQYGTVPRRDLQYWGQDNDWHRFRRGRARAEGGGVLRLDVSRWREDRRNLRGAHWIDPFDPGITALTSPYDYENPRYMGNLARSISASGFRDPITIRAKTTRGNLVTDGNHRLAVARALGLKRIPARLFDERGRFASPEGLGIKRAMSGRTVWSSDAPPTTMTFEVDGVNTPFYGTQAEIGEELRVLAAQGHEIRPPRRVFEAVGPTDIRSSGAMFRPRPKRAEGGPADKYENRRTDEPYRCSIDGEIVTTYAEMTIHEERHLKELGPAYRRKRAPWRRVPKRGYGGAVHAWHGVTARAYYSTLEHRGGTFPVSNIPVPTRGHAVGIAEFLGTQTQFADPNDPVSFMRAFHAQKRAGAPYVGTWWPEGENQIYVDPSTVIPRRREADMVARYGHEQAGYDLRKGDWPTSQRQLRATAARIAQIIYGRKRQGGGRVEKVSVASLLPYREINREYHPRYGRDFAYLDELTEQIRSEGGIREPVEVWYSPQAHRATVADGNHRLAVALRLGMDTIPATVKVPRSTRLRGARRMPGDPVPLDEGYYAPSKIGLRHGGGPVHALTGRQQAIAIERSKIFDQVISSIRDLAGTVTPALIKGGAQDWYSIAHAQALGDLADFGKLGLGNIGVGAFAAAAPGQSWDANRAILRRILRTGGYPRAQFTENVPGYSPVKAAANYGYTNWEKARQIIARQSLVGPNGEPLLTGPKVEPFYGNLSGQDVHSLTLDARMSRITRVPKWNTAFPGGSWQREILARAYSELYPEYQKAWGLHNESEFQAILWSAFGRGTDLGSDWARTKSGIAIPRHPGLVVPLHRALGGVVHPMSGFIPSIFQTAADWASDPFMAIMSWQQMQSQKQQGRAAGGPSGKGLYIVNEIGKELFVPQRLAHTIPKKVMDQIPKAKSGAFVIDQPANSLFAPPEDGIIIPHRLMDQIPHAERGKRARARAGGNERLFAERTPGEHEITMDYVLPTGGPPVITIPIRFAPARTVSPEVASVATSLMAERERTGPYAPHPANASLERVRAARISRLMGWGGATAALSAARARVAEAGPEQLDLGLRSRGEEYQAALAAGPAARAERMRQAERANKLRERREAREAAARTQAQRQKVTTEDWDALAKWSDPETAERQFGPRPGGPATGGPETGGPDIGGGAPRGPRRGTIGGGGGVPRRPSRMLGSERDDLLKFLNVTAPEPGYGHLLPARTSRGAVAAIASFIGVGKEQARKEKEYKEARTSLERQMEVSSDGLREYREKIIANTASLQDQGVAEDKIKASNEEITKSYFEGDGKLRKFGESLKNFQAKADAVTPSTGNVIKNLGVIIGATSAYGLAMQAANALIQPAIEGTIKAGQKFGDELLGWAPTFTATTNEMAKANVAMHGNIEATMAQAEQMAGMKASTDSLVGSVIAATVAAKSGATTYANFSNILRSGMRQGGPEGLYGGFGGVLGTSFLGSELGGGKGLAEQMVGDLSKFMSPAATTTMMGGKALDNAAALRAMSTQAAATTTQITTPPKTTDEQARKQWLAYMTTNLALGGAAGGQAFKLNANLTPGQMEQITNLKGVNQTVRDMATYGVGFTDAQGNILTAADDITKALEAVATGISMGDPSQAIRQMKWALGAAVESLQIQTQRAMTLTIPYGLTTQTIQQPLLPPGTGIFPGAAGGTPGVAAAGAGPASGFVKSLIAQQTQAQASVRTVAGQGMTEMINDISKNLGVWKAMEFGVYAADAMRVSLAIADINKKVGELQASASSLEWENSIRIAKRSLGDALGAAGLGPKKVAGIGPKGAAGTVAATPLGQMERASHFLEVSATKLSLALQERQITTQRALAGFQAPGETGEERYMRQKQALAEAAIAERKLTISQKEFGLSQAIWIENANRAAKDAQKAIDVMVAGQAAKVASAQAEQTIADNMKLLGQDTAKMDAIVNESQGNWSTALEAATGAVREFGPAIADVNKLMTGFKSGATFIPGLVANLDAMNQSLAQGTGAPSAGLPEERDRFGRGKPKQQGGSGAGGGWASGFLGDVNVPTQMIVGEAGNETVAILRNPRLNSFGGGGGAAPTTVNISINGPVVRGEQDISALAQAVAAEVERTLSRKGQMLGLRAPAY